LFWNRKTKRWDRAHRVSYLHHYGYIVRHLSVLHSCDNPPCVNPAHLSLGTQRDNLADMTAKGRRKAPPGHIDPVWYGRSQAGEANANARLTAADVADIRALGLAGYRQRDIAERFGVHQATVSYILAGKTWVGIEPSTAL
jgi:hypothetical protein